MRLDFNVLCIDDQPDRIKGAVDRFKLHIAEEGFELVVRYATSLEEASAVMADTIWKDIIDLVLVDYDLGTGSGGELALVRIKDAMPYKEVVFYSAASTDDLRRYAYEARVEGVYSANRAALAEVIISVFDALVKKVLDIDHTRGIIMGATSDLDHLVGDILQMIEGELTDEQREATAKYVFKRINEKIRDLEKLQAKLADSPTMEELLKAHAIFTSNDRMRLLIRIHEGLYATEHSFRETMKSYIAKIPGVRNLLGHVRLFPGQRDRALTGFGTEGVDPETLRDVRRELVRVRSEIQNFATALRSNASLRAAQGMEGEQEV